MTPAIVVASWVMAIAMLSTNGRDAAANQPARSDHRPTIGPAYESIDAPLLSPPSDQHGFANIRVRY